MKHFMQYFGGFLMTFAIFQAYAKDPAIVKVPAFKVIAVAAKSSRPIDFAAAYGKLVGYYAQPGHSFHVVFPQISLSLNGRNYAAIRFSGTPKVEGSVKVILLPTCTFLKQEYMGNYPGIAKAIDKMVKYAHSKGYTINSTCGIRVHELNSPDNTPVGKLLHEIYVPVIRLNF